MNTDLVMVLGILILVISFPASVGAFSSGRPPRLAMLCVFVGGGMMLYANSTKIGGYRLDEYPDLFIRVFSGLI